MISAADSIFAVSTHILVQRIGIVFFMLFVFGFLNQEGVSCKFDDTTSINERTAATALE